MRFLCSKPGRGESASCRRQGFCARATMMMRRCQKDCDAYGRRVDGSDVRAPGSGAREHLLDRWFDVKTAAYELLTVVCHLCGTSLSSPTAAVAARRGKGPFRRAAGTSSPKDAPTACRCVWSSLNARKVLSHKEVAAPTALRSLMPCVSTSWSVRSDVVPARPWPSFLRTLTQLIAYRHATVHN